MTIKELSRYKTLKAEAERLHQRLKSDIVTDTVAGSSPEYPYTKHSVKLSGIEKKCQDQLQRAYTKAYTELLKLEKYIQSVDDPLVRDIIRLRFIEIKRNGKPYGWDDLPDEIVGYSKDALKKKLYRYLRGKAVIDKPKVVTLCGSTRFKQQFEETNKRLTLEGTIVISVGCFGHSGDVFTDDQKITLDELHKRKIDMSDEILVINIGGYIGKSTQSEIEYAKSKGKGIAYLE